MTQVKKSLISAGLTILIGLSCWLYMYVSDKYHEQARQSDKAEILQLKLQREADTKKVEAWRMENERFKDSLFGMLVQKGQLEIELNRANEKLNQATSNYKQKRESKDDAKALVICDSIVYHHLPDYLIIDSSIKFIDDTLREFQGNWITQQADKIITLSDKLDTASSSLIKSKEENGELKDKEQSVKITKKEQRRRVWGAGFLGAAIGVIVVTIANLF